MSGAIILNGNIADAGRVEDSGLAEIQYIDGGHKWHKAKYKTAKADCGVWWESITCNCGKTYISATNGCWQQSHQWPEEGDKSLSPDFMSKEPISEM